MKRIFVVGALICLFAAAAVAQKNKPWTEWTAKDAEKILNDSAWGQTQTEESGGSESAQTSAISSTTAAKEKNVRSADAAASSAESGETKAPVALHYRVRFLSAKPIRAAFVRMVELQGAPAERVTELKPFVDGDFGNYIVITITPEGDRRRQMAVLQALSTADENTLKGTTYLERKDGTRLAMSQYRAPNQDGLGAKFVFPRTVEGKPFIDAAAGEVKFEIELGKLLKINRRFKISDMMYDGKLEF
jgi:hypothetical protein